MLEFDVPAEGAVGCSCERIPGRAPARTPGTAAGTPGAVTGSPAGRAAAVTAAGGGGMKALHGSETRPCIVYRPG